MEKLRAAQKYLSGMNFAYLLVLGLLAKALILDVSYATFLITVPILAYEGYKLYIKDKEPTPVQIDDAILKRLDAQKEELESIKSKFKAESFDRNINSSPKRYF